MPTQSGISVVVCRPPPSSQPASTIAPPAAPVASTPISGSTIIDRSWLSSRQAVASSSLPVARRGGTGAS
jgi:hypothetical protein